MRTAAAWSFPCGGCFFVGRRRALKNRSAAPASPPCFRRRRTGCGTQHPLRLACVSLAAAPTTPRCFRRWRRSSSLQSAPLLFGSTLATLYKLPDKTETPVSLQHWSSWWARVDYASRAAKNSLAGCFCAVFGDSAAAVRIHPWICFEKFRTKEKLQHLHDAGVFGGAKQPKSEPLPSGASLAAISSKVMVFVPSL